MPMELIEQLLAEAEAPNKEAAQDRPLPPCAVCAGHKPGIVGKEVKDSNNIVAQLVYYKYPGDVRVVGAIIPSPLFTMVEAVRMRDEKSGAEADIHYCFNRGRLELSLRAPIPDSAAERDRLVFFLKQAQKLRETRGLKRKREIEIEDVYEALRRRPNASVTWLAAELDLPPRTLQYLFKTAGLSGIKDAREKAKKWGGKTRNK